MTAEHMTPPPKRRSGLMRRGAPVVKPKDMKGTLRRLWGLTSGSRKGLGWILFLSALTSASAILSPLLIGIAVSAIDAGKPALKLLGLLAGLYLADWCVNFLQKFFMASVGQRVILAVRTSLFSAMKKLPLLFFDRRQHGELMSRLTNDVDNISSTLSDSLTMLLTYAFTIVGIFCMMMFLNTALTLVSLASVVFIFLFTRAITKRTRKLYRKQQELLGKLDGQVEESISGLSLVKAFGREKQTAAQFESANGEFCDVATRAQIWSGYLMPVMNVVNNFCFVLIAVISGVMAEKGQIAVGTISSFLLYTRQFSRPFVNIASIYNDFQTAVAGAERIFEIFDEKPEPEDAPDALPLTNPRGEVRFEHVSFSYEPGKPVLKDISLSVPAGTRAAIVGPTGSGKTTLVNLLTRFYDVGSGRILLDGHDLRRYRMRDLRGAFSVVLQDTALFGVSVRDNIAYGSRNVPFEKVRAAAVTAGADSFIRRLPQGYDTVLAQGGAELSQGERQLLTIARAVLADAPILILDEATSSVDTVTEQKIRRAVLAVSSGRTSFLIAHRLSTVRDSDVIIVLSDGCIEEQGTHGQLMALGGKYASMYRTQTGIE